MAQATRLMPFILKWEGGYVNDPDDKGGATNRGVTLATFRHYYGSEKTAAQLRNLTNHQWLTIFKDGYWDRWKADQILNQNLANILVDWVWASGVHGIKIPQRLLNVEADGKVGPITLTALNSKEPEPFFKEIQAARIKFVENICEKDPTQLKFLKGWINRINDLKYEED